LQAFVGVCHAVAYAHSRGVVHRDLKPENVVLGGFGEVVVLDWGLAKLVDAPEARDPDRSRLALSEGSQTQATLGQVGSPAYMAPEQAEGRNDLVDDRTDIYGLGATLYAILTGKPPWDGPDTLELLQRIVAAETPQARAVEPSASKGLEAICAQAMAKERSRRYAKASELARDVESYLAGEPVSAYREPWTAKARRWVRKHQTLAASLLVGLLMGTALLAVVALLQAQARAAQERSNTLLKGECLASIRIPG
jgi:serine/threonine protein kinase